jgi:DNA-binding response OmpR family regulator
MKWIVLCVSHDAASLLLYRSILELEGHYALVVANADEAVKVSEEITIDCVVVDCADNGISVTREIARGRPGIPILFVSDQLEIQVQVYSETGMFVTKEEAIGELSRCICEMIRRTGYRCEEDPRGSCTSTADSRALHSALVSWLLPW